MPTEWLSAADISHKVRRLASQIVEAHPDDSLVLLGIHTRGVVLAERVRDAITEMRDASLEFGTLDIALYRDDLDNLGTIPAIRGSNIPGSLEGREIVLFDDVLFTGRTIRAAIEHLMDYGRPARIQLAVLVDRGNRELPIQADYVGEARETTRAQFVTVRFAETDEGEEGVWLTE